MNTTNPLPADVLARLVAFDATLDPGTNKHDRVSVLIAACIAEGITKGSVIRSALMELGYDGDHVAIMLKKGSGSRPPESRWYRDDSGVYRLP
jgi:hypothetical protein